MQHVRVKWKGWKILVKYKTCVGNCRSLEELGAIVQGIICESGNEKDCDANDFTSGRASYKAIKTKQTLMEENCSLVTKEKICCCSE